MQALILYHIQNCPSSGVYGNLLSEIVPLTPLTVTLSCIGRILPDYVYGVCISHYCRKGSMYVCIALSRRRRIVLVICHIYVMTHL